MLLFLHFFVASLYIISCDLGICRVHLEHNNSRYAGYSMVYSSFFFINFVFKSSAIRTKGKPIKPWLTPVLRRLAPVIITHFGADFNWVS